MTAAASKAELPAETSTLAGAALLAGSSVLMKEYTALRMVKRAEVRLEGAMAAVGMFTVKLTRLEPGSKKVDHVRPVLISF